MRELQPNPSPTINQVALTGSVSPQGSKRVLCVWLPNWPIQRIQAVDPQLANRPVALTSRDPRRGLVVSAANLLARAAGVRSQMRVAEASGLIDLELQEHQPEEDFQALCCLAEQAQRFSPLVGIEQLDRRLWAGRTLHQPESLLLDVTGLEHLFGGYDNLLSQLGGWLHSQNYFGCLALAGHTAAAWALANYALRSSAGGDPHRNGASTADPSEKSCVPASRYLQIDMAQQFDLLQRLPLAALRIDPATLSTLGRLGLSQIGQLFRLPRAGIASRLDSQLLVRWDQIIGQREEPIVALHASPDWCVQHELEIPTEHIPTIAELVRRGMQQLGRSLERQGQGALRIVCRLDCVEHQSLVLQMGMFRPTSDPDYLNRLAVTLIEQQLSQKMPAPLCRVSVQATLTAPLVWRQGELFQAHQAASRQQVAGLIDMLSVRLGRKHVLKARVHRQMQPESAYALTPLTGLRPDGSVSTATNRLPVRPSMTLGPATHDPLRRPARLLPCPKPISVMGALGTETTQPRAAAPAQVKTANGWHRVLEAVGPERLESGWWTGPSHRRDYYRIITHLGCWWWIFRDLRTGQWYLHGIFD